VAASPSVVSFAGLLCAPAGVYLTLGLGAGVLALCPTLLVAGRALSALIEG
jgi:hypothetical protein